ncbi:DUF1028 domain-containing protein [Sphingobium sp. AP50]|uniref:DUF1028 domain-containing protein n=1 Tax=Sphingobium sp. AP50 TaxID=1884369 RepID=UPI002108F220|nr:DUF1028 domain-containing protein [Sphingobium sp. AP50]
MVRKLETVMVPSKGVSDTQAYVDSSLQNQTVIADGLKQGLAPAAISDKSKAVPQFDMDQFGIVDVQGRITAVSGLKLRRDAQDRTEHMPGNTVTGATVPAMTAALKQVRGALADRAVAALEAGKRAGGDTRCKCLDATPGQAEPCNHRHSKFAYLVIADSNTPVRRICPIRFLRSALCVASRGGSGCD